jgi:hypothetical protein
LSALCPLYQTPIFLIVPAVSLLATAKEVVKDAPIVHPA